MQRQSWLQGSGLPCSQLAPEVLVVLGLPAVAVPVVVQVVPVVVVALGLELEGRVLVVPEEPVVVVAAVGLLPLPLLLA